MSTKILPTLIIVIGIAAGLVYSCYKDIRHTAYWLAAAFITAAVIL